MWRTIKKYLKPANYLHRLNKLRRSRKVSALKRRKPKVADFIPLWSVVKESGGSPAAEEPPVSAFGIVAEPDINWMKDVPGNHIFPAIRMDKIKISDYYDQGIDVKYPWEISRFLFGNELAAQYTLSGNKDHYKRFRNLVLDWIEGNPFLLGVNWACTMDVAIRATNWILAANAFSDEINKDFEFLRLFSASLVQHGMHIHSFPEIYPGKHSTNHTTADYVGLLYVARALPQHPDAAKWEKMAVQGLKSCMDYQVYPDGGSFEASSGYHRLVTELFGLGALLCLNHGIPLPASYYSKLHSMFGFLFSLMDPHGNVPLFGDNDSGTLLQFDFARNHNYSYMKEFYSLLFSGESVKEATKSKAMFSLLMPAEGKVYKSPERSAMLKSKEERFFRDSGILTFQQGRLSGCIQFIPIGQNGQGGHNHLDVGSFTLFHSGKAIVVDPGVYTYTRDLQARNSYRSYSQHNTLIPAGISDELFKLDKLFRLNPYYSLHSCGLEDEQRFRLSYSLLNHPHPISREYKWEEESFMITDTCSGPFEVKLHLGPEAEILETLPGQIRTRLFTLHFSPDREFHVDAYDYAEKYQTRRASRSLTITAESHATMHFEFGHGE